MSHSTVQRIWYLDLKLHKVHTSTPRSSSQPIRDGPLAFSGTLVRQSTGCRCGRFALTSATTACLVTVALRASCGNRQVDHSAGVGESRDRRAAERAAPVEQGADADRHPVPLLVIGGANPEIDAFG